MNAIFGGQVYLIDMDIDRAQLFKERLFEVNPRIFFYHFISVREAFDFALTSGIIIPDHIFIHVSLADFSAKDVLKRYRMICRVKLTKFTVYGLSIQEGYLKASIKYNFSLLHGSQTDGSEGFVAFNSFFNAENGKNILIR